MHLARRLRPETVLLENVPEMADTMILDEHGRPTPILGYVERALGAEYVGRAEVVEFADYGVPQFRQRLITVYSRHPGIADWLRSCGTLMPTPTHAANGGDGKARWLTVRDAIEGLPPLDAGSRECATSALPFHRVPLLDDMKYWWVANTRQIAAPSTTSAALADSRRTRRTVPPATTPASTVLPERRRCTARGVARCCPGRAWSAMASGN